METHIVHCAIPEIIIIFHRDDNDDPRCCPHDLNGTADSRDALAWPPNPRIRTPRGPVAWHVAPPFAIRLALRSVSRFMLPGQDTLIACWAALATISRGAEVVRSPTSVAAVFPAWVPLNNAIAVASLDSEPMAKRDVLRLAAEYASAGVDTWAYWIPSGARTFDARDEIVLHGVERDITTLVMTAALADQFRSDSEVMRTSIFSAVQATDAAVPVAKLDAPDGVPGLDAWVLVVDGMAVCGAWTFRHGGDCGVYGVGTVPELRRRGLARRLMEHVLDHAAQLGAGSASLQSTAMGQRLYESLGFLPAGRYEEWLYSATGA